MLYFRDIHEPFVANSNQSIMKKYKNIHKYPNEFQFCHENQMHFVVI